MQDTKKVKLADIIAMEPGYINDSWESVVVVETKFDPATGEKFYKAKLQQMGDPKTSITAKFWGSVDLSQLNGKLVEFGGPGLQRTVYKPEKSPKPIQQVSISDKSRAGEILDNWRIVATSAHADRPLDQFPAHAPDNGRGSPASSSVQSGGVPAESNEPVEDRIEAYFKIFEDVCVTAGHDPVKEMSALSPSDLKEITTGIVMSFKAAYGMHAQPHFRQAGFTQGSLDKAPAAEWGGVSTWKDTKHPATGKTLSEISLEDQLKLVRWAYSHPEAKDKVFRGSVLMMAGSIGVGSPSSCLTTSLASHPAYGKPDGFSDEDLDKKLGNQFGLTMRGMDDAKATEILGVYDKFVEELLVLAEEYRKDLIPY